METLGNKNIDNPNQSNAVTNNHDNITTSLDKNAKRDFLFDNIRGILIILVVFGHLIRPETSNVYTDSIYTFIYFFHMPVFIFISGYFSKNLQKSHDNAIKTFLIPFLVFNFASYMLDMFLGSGLYFFNMKILDPQWGLWFLLCMFLWKCFLKDYIKIKHCFILSIAIGLIAGLFKGFGIYLALGRALAFLPFFLAGYFLNRNHLKKVFKVPNFLSYVTIIGVILLAFFVTIKELLPMEMLYFRVAYQYSELGTVAGFLTRAALYVIAFLMIFAIIRSCTHKETFLTKIGQNTLPVYIGHLFILAVVAPKLSVITDPIIYTAVVTVVTLIIVFTLSLPFWGKLYNRFFDMLYKFIFIKDKS